MEQVPVQGPETIGFWRKYGGYAVLAVIIAAIAVGYFAARDDRRDQDKDRKEDRSEQVGGEKTNQKQDQDQIVTSRPPAEIPGNVTASGTLRTSDNQNRGKLMVVEQAGRKIYIATKRDFSGLVGKNVKLAAQGTIEEFVFLNLEEEAVSAPEKTAGAGTVNFSGKLQRSDNENRGNYQIITDGTKVYLKSVHDYSSLVGSEVNVSASGSIENFTGARVSRK